MESIPLKLEGYDCDGANNSLSICNEKILEPYGTQYCDEQKVLLLRAGFDPEDENVSALEICDIHRKILGKKFMMFVRNTDCLHPDNGEFRRDKAD